MESVKYCAYNTTKASFLNLRITVVDTLNERFDNHMEGLAHNAQAGLWLNPCREIPVGDGLLAFDIVYLDEACRVVQVVELSPGGPRAVPAATAASALALPSHTISASQTKCGDELMIWASYGEEKRPGRMSRTAAAARVGPVRESAIASVLAVPSGSAPSWAGGDAGLPQAAFERLDEKEKAESPSEEKPTLTARFKTWTSENLTHRGADVPISVIPVSVAPASVAPASVAPAQVLRASIAPAPVASAPVTSAPVTPSVVAREPASFIAKPSAALSRAVPPPAGDVPTRPQAAFERLDENEMAEFTHEERPSFTSRLRNWTFERLAHQSAGEPASVTAVPVSPASISPAPVSMTAAPVSMAPASASIIPVPVSIGPASASITPAPVSMAAASASIIPVPVSMAPASVEPARVIPVSIASGAMTPAPVAQAPVISAAIRHASVAPAAVAQRTESFIATQSPAPRSAAPFSAVAPPRRSQVATERLDEKEKAESRPVEKTSAVTPFKTRNGESVAPQRADVPIAVTPASMPPAAVARSAASPLTKQSPTQQAAPPAPAVEMPTRPPASIERMGDKKKAEPQYQRKRSWLTRLVRWVSGTPEPAERYHLPGLVAYFWTGGSPQAHPVSNISTSGLYLLTKERWMSDTVLLMNLQNGVREKGDSAGSISVLSRVVRRGEDGVGLKFVTPDSLDGHAGQMLPPIQTDKETLERFLKGFKRAEQVEVK